MSLKAFHLVFIALSLVLSVVCAWWAFTNNVGGYFGVGSSVAAVALFFYGIWFVRKSRHIIT